MWNLLLDVHGFINEVQITIDLPLYILPYRTASYCNICKRWKYEYILEILETQMQNKKIDKILKEIICPL